ncbi:hypothetical protein BS78_01G177800 [Paspalum vaginatum]|nr:hypothetical protein BS78_01G177800 [Paspalum vaginatum]
MGGVNGGGVALADQMASALRGDRIWATYREMSPNEYFQSHRPLLHCQSRRTPNPRALHPRMDEAGIQRRWRRPHMNTSAKFQLPFLRSTYPTDESKESWWAERRLHACSLRMHMVHSRVLRYSLQTVRRAGALTVHSFYVSPVSEPLCTLGGVAGTWYYTTTAFSIFHQSLYVEDSMGCGKGNGESRRRKSALCSARGTSHGPPATNERQRPGNAHVVTREAAS